MKYNILKEYEQNLMRVMDILGSGTTDNLQLDKLGKYLFDDKFVGVYSSNDMPVLKNNQMCIVNTDASYEKGTHWIACYKYNGRTYCYDSFDRDVKSLSKYWKKKHNWVNANRDRDQSYEEMDCGQRSLCFLLSFQKNKLKCIGII